AGVADTLSAVAPYRTVNIANGSPVRLMDFVSVVERSLGRKAQINYLPVQPGEMQQTFGDAALLQALTGYKPQIAIEDGVPQFVEWCSDFYGARLAQIRPRPALVAYPAAGTRSLRSLRSGTRTPNGADA